MKNMARNRERRQPIQPWAPCQQLNPITALKTTNNRRAQYHSQDRFRQQRLASQQPQGIPKKMHQQQRASLQDRITRGDQAQSELQPSCESQAARGQAGKRKRGDSDYGAQQQKKTCLEIDSKSASTAEMTPAKTDSQVDVFENIVQSATSIKSLKNLSDAQKMANRRNRFANVPVDRRVLGASRTSKANKSLLASTPKSYGERQAAVLLDAAIDQTAASYNGIATANGNDCDKHVHDTAPVGKAIVTENKDAGRKSDKKLPAAASTASVSEVIATENKDAGRKSDKKLPAAASIAPVHGTPSKTVPIHHEDAAIETRADSVIQSSPASNAEGLKRCGSDACEPAKTKLEKPRVVTNNDKKPIVLPNPECIVEYFPYDCTSVLLMASHHIAHDEEAEELVDRWDNSNPILNRQAMDMYQRRWRSEDFGRGPVSKTLPARVINDCDLYFRDDQKIYVATEMGLMLVADYCNLIDMPNDQAVRFEGRKPKWAKKLEATRQHRRVTESFDPEDVYFEEGIPLISLGAGHTVEVYEIFQELDENGDVWDIAYGMRTEDLVRGFFDYKCTCRLDWKADPEDDLINPSPKVIDWSKFDYGPGARRAREYMADVAAGKYKQPRLVPGKYSR